MGTIFQIRVAELQRTTVEAWAGLLVAVVSAVIITGLYPAMVCIKRNTFNIFVSHTTRDSKRTISQFLTTAQFTAAIVLISWTLIVYVQLNHILTIDIGMDREGVVIIEGPVVKPENYSQKIQTFGRRLKNIAGVADVTTSRYMVGDTDWNKPGELIVAGTNIKSGSEVNGVNEDYIPFFGLKLLAGRNFNPDEKDNSIIISKQTAQRLGFREPGNAVGIKMGTVTGNGGATLETEVIGVIEDYRIAPYFDYTRTNTSLVLGGYGVALLYSDKLFPELSPEKIALKVNIKDVRGTIAVIESQFHDSFPGNVFEWKFLDDQINRAYADEKIARNQLLLFTVLAIGIAILGLVATMTHRISLKTKEIGTRKILGAKGIQIGQLLVNSFLFQFLVAGFIAIPVAHYLGNQYLQKYSDQVAIEWWLYLIPLAILMLIMFTAIASLLRKAANTNPVESLRYQ
jgi:putative ABC transport system permease protein